MCLTPIQPNPMASLLLLLLLHCNNHNDAAQRQYRRRQHIVGSRPGSGAYSQHRFHQTYMLVMYV